jgi:hypothetical protein
MPYSDEQRSAMPRVPVPHTVTARSREAVVTEHLPSELLANEHHADQVVERMEWALVNAEQQIKEFYAPHGGSPAAPPSRSVRRSTARRASNRRAVARIRRGDTKASIIAFLTQHQGSTAGDLAKGLDLSPGSAAARLTQLANAGEIRKSSRGYRTT